MFFCNSDKGKELLAFEELRLHFPQSQDLETKLQTATQGNQIKYQSLPKINQSISRSPSQPFPAATCPWYHTPLWPLSLLLLQAMVSELHCHLFLHGCHAMGQLLAQVYSNQQKSKTTHVLCVASGSSKEGGKGKQNKTKKSQENRGPAKFVVEFIWTTQYAEH